MSVDLQPNFDTFIEDIAIGGKQIERMDSAVNAITTFLMGKYGLPAANFFQQGSYPNGTAVEPVEGGEYDVDLVAYCVAPGGSPDQALNALHRHFADDGRYKDRLKTKKPCVRLDYQEDEVGKFHVDVVPVRQDESGLAPYQAPRRQDGWHATAPAEYTNWCREQGDSYRRTVLAFKRWRDEQQAVKGKAIKSIVLQVLVAQHMPLEGDDAFRFAGTVANMLGALGHLTSPPSVMNPVLESENLAGRWTKESFQGFIDELREAQDWLVKARAANDLVEAVACWQEVLGTSFPAPPASALGLELQDTEHEKEFRDQGWQEGIDRRYRVTVKTTEQIGKGGKPKPYTSAGRAIMNGHKVRFKATIIAPPDTEVWWRVTNTGGHARSVSGLRGDFLKAKSISGGTSKDPTEHWESTTYTGSHQVRAVLVRNRTVIAYSSYVLINIWNRSWRRPW